MSNIFAFFNRKDCCHNMYNYNLSGLITDFSFYDFICKSQFGDHYEYGAFAVITDKQYVVGYNAGYGVGTHFSSYARFMKDIKGGGYIYNASDAKKLSDKCIFNNITIKIYYEEIRAEGCLPPKRWGGVIVSLPIRKISEGQLRAFKKFYEDYNEDLKSAIKKSNGALSVSLVSSRGAINHLDSLDKVLEEIEETVDYDFIPPDEKEIIIGTEIENFRKTKKF